MKVLMNAAMSLDGKIATKSGDAKFSSLRDLKELHKLRASADAILVGIGTIIKDNPRLTVRYAKGRNPSRIVIDSNARIPLTSNALINNCRHVIVAVSKKADLQKIKKLESLGARVLPCGMKKVNLRMLMHKLPSLGIRNLLLEGGSLLNWSMLKERLVTDLRVTISPVIVGGRNAKSLAEGEGFSRIKSSFRLKLVKTERHGSELISYYKLLR